MFSLSEEILERHQIRVCEILEELGLTPDQANRKKSRMLKKIKRETGLESHQTGMYLVNQEHDWSHQANLNLNRYYHCRTGYYFSLDLPNYSLDPEVDPETDSRFRENDIVQDDKLSLPF